MYRSLSPIERLAVVVSSAVFAALAFVLCLEMMIAPSYPDFIVDAISWSAASKLQDILVGPLSLVVAGIGLLFFTKRIHRLKNQMGEEHSIELSNQLLLWSVPAFIAIFGFFFHMRLTIDGLVLSAIGIVVVTALCFYHGKNETYYSTISFSLIAVIFISCIPFEIYLVAGRLSHDALAGHKVKLYTQTVPAILLVSGIIFICSCAVKNNRILERALPKLLLVGQIGLSVLFVALYPSMFVTHEGEITSYNTTIWLKIFIAFCVLGAIYDIIRRYIKNKSSNSLKFLFSPIAIFALFIGFIFASTYPPVVPADDYHFGEKFVGWLSYSHGAIPYLDYIPAHGMVVDDLPMFFSSIFYDGTVASVEQAGKIGIAIILFIIFISTLYCSKNILFSFLIIVGSVFSGLLHLVPFFALWCSPDLREKPAKWLIMWLLSAPILILAVPPHGMLLVAASGIMVLACLWSQWQHGTPRSWVAIIAVFLGLLALALATPVGMMLFAAIRYVLENGFINQIAYGIPWKWSEEENFPIALLRMTWMFVAFFLLVIIYKRRKEFLHPTTIIYPAIFAFLFILLVIPYSMGRIDNDGISRLGIVSLFGLSVLLPFVFWMMADAQKKVLPFLSILCICISAGFVRSYETVSVSRMASIVSPIINTAALKDGKTVGLNNLGVGIVDDAHWKRLTRLNALLNSKLPPEVPYLDLSGRNAHYFYFNRRPVVEVTAPYNMVAPAQQKRIVEKLEKNLPSLALLQAENINHDGGGLALRNPILYRFVMDNYIPSWEDGFIIGYPKNSDAHPSVISDHMTIDPITDKDWEKGIHRKNAAIVLKDSVIILLAHVGDQLRIGGELRTVTNVQPETRALYFDGPPFKLETLTENDVIEIPLTPQRIKESRAILFQNAFVVDKHLQKLPVSWGKSAKSLAKKMNFIQNLDGMVSQYHDVSLEGDSYKVTGRDPHIRIDMPDMSIAGRDAGLLKFDFTCAGRRQNPQIQIFWWGDEHQQPSELYSLKFTAAKKGSLIVPLDASPLWLSLDKVRGVRIDLDNADACHSFKLKNIELFQRKF